MTPARVAYFVSSHGFGHAARAAAVMEALGRRLDVGVELVTATPRWFFEQSLTVPFRYRRAMTDVGLVQRGPVEEDPTATVGALEAFWRDLPRIAEPFVRSWRESGPELVVSDISPLGLEVARRLGRPSVLVENFTWEWIYRGYAAAAPRLLEFGARYAELAAGVTLRVQCEPVCARVAGAVQVAPVSREPRWDRATTRRALGIETDDERPLVLFTMGGFGWGGADLEPTEEYWLATLGGVPEMSRRGTRLRLPDRSPIFPPDLISAADAVVAKLGYSTVAECYRAGARLGWVGRAAFAESAVLEEFVCRHLPVVEISREELASGGWKPRVAELLRRRRPPARAENGARAIAERLRPWLG